MSLDCLRVSQVRSQSTPISPQQSLIGLPSLSHNSSIKLILRVFIQQLLLEVELKISLLPLQEKIESLHHNTFFSINGPVNSF